MACLSRLQYECSSLATAPLDSFSPLAVCLECALQQGWPHAALPAGLMLDLHTDSAMPSLSGMCPIIWVCLTGASKPHLWCGFKVPMASPQEVPFPTAVSCPLQSSSAGCHMHQCHAVLPAAHGKVKGSCRCHAGCSQGSTCWTSCCSTCGTSCSLCGAPTMHLSTAGGAVPDKLIRRMYKMVCHVCLQAGWSEGSCRCRWAEDRLCRHEPDHLP